jgi:site-specific DNA recombinase
VTAPVVSWMFAQRLAGHSAARITKALNDAGVPCPSAADPGQNPHRTGSGWTLRMTIKHARERLLMGI